MRLNNGPILLLMLIFFSATAQEDGWQMLFNGENLDGWKQINGTATYAVKDGAIVGTTVEGSPNSFLCTEKMYGDFILEYEVKVDPQLNSGVQIRSNSFADHMNGRVHGYQVEIDPSKRAYSGGIYDEARRGWLNPLAHNPDGRKAFVNGAWNHFRVEAVGSSIRTWINGVQCANLADDMTASGFIGLQVHSVGSKEQVGIHVKWRNLKIIENPSASDRKAVSPTFPVVNNLVNQLTVEEKRQGWRLLWDGKTSNGWRGAKLSTFPDRGWQIEDGVLTVMKSDGGESTNGGDIVTVDEFSSFELQLEFRITEGANSGIKYFVDTELNQGAGSSIGLGYQILDDKAHPDAENGVGGNRTVASLYDLIPAENLSVPNRSKPMRGPGEWNRARLVVNGKHVEHWLNGMKVVEYERSSQIYRALVAKSKYKVWTAFGEAAHGHILLQDHGDEVSFRSIKIREF